MKQNRSLYIILALLTIINLGIGTATAIKEQSTVVELHDGDMAVCICGAATPEPTETPENTPTAEPTATDTPEPTNTPTLTATPEPTPMATPTVTATPTATPEPGIGKPFGPFNWVPDGEWPFTASRLGRDLSHYELARQHGVTVLAALTGGHSSYTDGNGCFSVQMWQDALDRNNLTAFQSYVNDGTIGGLYAIDEPHDWGNDCGPTLADIDAICGYAQQRLPGILCGVNAPVFWLSGYDYEHLGFIFTQTNFQRTSDWAAWAEQQFADAVWFDGDVWLSINAYTSNPTAAQIRDAAIALCQSNAAGVMMWKWGQPDFNSLPGMREAMEEAAAACGGTQ